VADQVDAVMDFVKATGAESRPDLIGGHPPREQLAARHDSTLAACKRRYHPVRASAA
jgi:hypothetical protein